ncbi:hypothetical protein COO60DRAFT_1697553 [Scenedesmus sp. NREL 46B-D3]|nr:hypothetical protein COO60DRAFT_1697553 [Scenedesmus sp. NREL 46B-D3]
MVQVDFTVQRFPAAGPLKEACGIPLSCVVQPMKGGTSKGPLTTAMLYINHLCDLSDSSFTCSVCGRSTGLKHLTQWHSTYCRYPAARQHLPELTQQVFEVVVDPDLQGPAAPGLQQQQQGPPAGSAAAAAAAVAAQGVAGQPAAVPVTLLLVDTAGPDEFLDLVRGALGLGLDALPPDSLVGLLGVSDCITLVDMAGPAGPMLHHLPVLEAVPVLVPLQDVLPLSSLLLPVAAAKQRIAQALELLLPAPTSTAAASSNGSSSSRGLQQPGMDRRGPAGPAAADNSSSSSAGGSASSSSSSSTAAGSQQQQQHAASSGGRSPPCRAIGPALHAVLEYLRALHAPHTDPSSLGSSEGPSSPRDSSGGTPPSSSGVAQLVLFLSGPPDTGYGKTVAATAAGGRPPGSSVADATISPASGDLGRQMAGLQLHFPSQDPKSRSFYEQAAVAAASMGVVVDVYAAARGYIGLQTLEPLVNSTGGALYLYPSAEEATLPQDLSRRLAAPKALSGMLRLRACPQLKVARCYGRLYADPQHGDLFHVPCCDPGHSFVFDFDHAGPGAYDEQLQQVTLQVAFQYSQVVAVGSGPGSHGLPPSGGGSSGSRPQAAAAAAGDADTGSGSSLAALASGAGGRSFVVQRRLRVCTLRLPVAHGPAEVYSSVDADTVLTVLTHKITKAVRTQSVSEARLLLRDWLVIFTANYHRNSFMRASAAQLLQLPVDLTFSSCPPLQPLPRLVYALLRSPLLSSAAQHHSDLTAYLHHLWCCLPPRELAKAVYPGLSAFADSDTLIAEGLALSRNSLQGPQLAEAAAAAARQGVTAAAAASQAAACAAAGAAADSADAAAEYNTAQAALALAGAVAEGKQAANILLLDAFILVLVVFRAGAPGQLPFPPPQQSKLSRIIADIKRERRVTTHVEVVREGGDGADLFNSLLIDDPDELAEMPIPPLGQQQPGAGAGAADAAVGGAGAAAGEDVGERAAGPSPTGVAQFIEHIKAEVFTQLQPQH